MNNKYDIQNEIEKTLSSVDNIQQATANPFLYTRIKARLEREDNIWGRITSYISKPAFAITVVFVILLANSWVISQDNKEDDASSYTVAPGGDSQDEYNLAVNTFYDYETPE